MFTSTILSRRDALRLGAAGGGSLAAPSVPGKPAARKSAAVQTVFDVTAYGAVGDGQTDDTTAIQNALDAAGEVDGSTVSFPPAPGGCYRISGVTVPGDVARLTGESALYSKNAPLVSLTGSVLAPTSTTVTDLLKIGVSGDGKVVNSNPHGLTVSGLGFLGTVPTATSPAAVPGLWGATVVDTSDVTFANCRDLYCGSPAFAGYPTGGTGEGGFARFLSSGTDNFFSVNAQITSCSSFGAGHFVLADGLSPKFPGGGSTDGRISNCQVNGHDLAVSLGPFQAGAGGWFITDTHFSSPFGAGHVDYGDAGNPWTLRIANSYFDVCNGVPLSCGGRGLQLVGNYFRALNNTTAVEFTSKLATVGRDPGALIADNVVDLDGSTTLAAFVRILGFTAAGFVPRGGGVFQGNLIHNHGAPMPKSWVGQYIGSDGHAIADASTSTLTIVNGPQLSA
jgi:Pectate lyase superfamily protein